MVQKNAKSVGNLLYVVCMQIWYFLYFAIFINFEYCILFHRVLGKSETVHTINWWILFVNRQPKVTNGEFASAVNTGLPPCIDSTEVKIKMSLIKLTYLLYSQFMDYWIITKHYSIVTIWVNLNIKRNNIKSYESIRIEIRIELLTTKKFHSLQSNQ